MTDPQHDRHDAAEARLDRQEATARKNRNYLLITALTALAGGSGSATALLGNDDDKLKDVIAVHVASASEWRPAVDEELRALREQQIKMREALVKLQTIMEERTRGGGDRANLEEIEALLEGIAAAPRKARGARAPPKAADVQQYRKELFAD